MGNIEALLPCLEREPDEEYEGYRCGQPLTDGGQDLGACKHIQVGLRIQDNTPCVLCFTQEGRSQLELLHEHELLKHVGKHPNIINQLDYFKEWPGSWYNRTSCLVLECVSPPGNDLFEVHNAFKNTGSFMPMNQLKWYCEQLADGMEHINKKGVVHRDMKVENVLINDQHQVKIIDFGLAVCPPRWVIHDSNLRDEYFAPELEEGGHDFEAIKNADLWGIGCVVYYLGTGKKLSTIQVRHWHECNMFHRMVESKLACNKSDFPYFMKILDRVLQIRPDLRGTFAEVKEWAKVDDPIQRITSSDHQFRLKKWPFRSGVPQALALFIPKDWKDKLNGKSIGELALAELGLLVIVVVRIDDCGHKREIIACPNASTQLFRGDLLYFGVNKKRFDEREFKRRLGFSPHHHIDFASAKSRKKTDVAWFFPVFDAFDFKDHHVSGILGPQDILNKGSTVARKALNVRRNFRMNICGIVHKETKAVEWWPGPEAMIAEGDKGLILRVPNFLTKGDEADEEIGGPAIDLDDLDAFLQEDKFLARLKEAA